MSSNENREYSIFDKPSEHNDRPPQNKKNHKKAIALIGGLLAAVLIFTGAFLIVRFMPEQDKESEENEFEPFKIMEISTEDFTAITVKSGEETVELYSEQITEKDDDGNTDTDTVWYIKGYDKSDVSASITELISSVSNITAYMQIDKKTASECGFDNPRYEISVETQDNKGYTILIGDNSPDNFGLYLKFADSDKIYLVSEELIDAFELKAESIIESASSQA